MASGIVVDEIKRFPFVTWPQNNTCFEGLFHFISGSSIITHHLSKFNCQRSFSDKDITYITCHVVLQDPMIKRLFDFIEESSSLYRTTLPSLKAVVIVVVEIQHIWCIKWTYKITHSKGPLNLWREDPHWR